MVPTAFWAALAVGLQLWAAGRAVPTQAVFIPYVPEPGSSCRLQEYYDTKVQMCCSKCPPGYRVQSLCNKTSDTVCHSCESSTYTQLWNLVPACFSCNSRCSSDQLETQACTTKQNRICTCKPGWYCTLGRQEGCRLCVPLRKCGPGFGVAKPGTATSNVACAPCAPGTFSDTTSSMDTCRPHRICSSVAIRGTSEMDAVCTSVLPTLKAAPGPALTRSQPMEPTPGSSTAPSTSGRLPMAPGPPSYPVEGRNTANISLPIGLIVGVTALGLLIIVLVNCVIMTQKKKKPFCLHGDAKVPHLPADKARSAPGPEQQHLLTTAPSSSSSSLESSASAADRRAPTRPQLQAPGAEKAPASCGSSAEASSGGHGTQVNVTCIVNVCSSSDHSSQCPSQASSTRDTDTSASGSPKDEQVPFSKEECPFQSQPGAPETLLQSPEEKPLPLGVPDAGMKPS
ncbi:tumor necrosis factor receptor superfamily member 1B [Mesoplodon densirostris]|uniref:tumor necrosis factor receptor superfamily member 1B n=1 Tax=Mesoplodon densirostris TaxID=48708 RepID=UPI0028DB6A66|nr:tumor necrosis factor receptor superfamily member 1B [Mesoplodon densirostris]XP_059935841.1 tumor necrosis factor receptor superfamily member 1B [Mesoplodon densirostris]